MSDLLHICLETLILKAERRDRKLMRSLRSSARGAALLLSCRSSEPRIDNQPTGRRRATTYVLELRRQLRGSLQVLRIAPWRPDYHDDAARRAAGSAQRAARLGTRDPARAYGPRGDRAARGRHPARPLSADSQRLSVADARQRSGSRPRLRAPRRRRSDLHADAGHIL